MAKYIVSDTDLTSIANAIRTKGGTSASLSFPTGFVDAINAIDTGGGGLPDDYEQVDWIQATGNAYIDTNYTPTSDTTAEIEYELTSNASGNYYLFGEDGNSPYIKAEYRYGYRWYCRAVGKQVAYPSNFDGNGLTANTKYKITLNKSEFSINSITVTPDNSSGLNNGKIFLFAGNQNGTAIEIITIMKVYGFKLYENDTLSLELVPCYRKADDEPGMYDTVSKTFYTNAGTGNFVIPT